MKLNNTSNKIKARELSNRKMVDGNENKYSIVIDRYIIKEWVGIGWIELRPANKDDEYPEVKYE